MTPTKRTAGPWLVDHLEHGQPAIYTPRGLICTMEAGYGATRESDAAFIVEACNAYDSLRASNAAMKDALIWIKECAENNTDIGYWHLDEIAARADAALEVIR